MKEVIATLANKQIEPESGHCFVALIPAFQPGDTMEATNGSQLVVLEDGRSLGPPHSLHDDIRRIGKGRYSHWGDALYFSTSDNSDPRTSGRTYTVRGSRREGVVPESQVVRGWEVIPSFIDSAVPRVVLDEMEQHPEASGKSSWGTRNILQAFVLSMRPRSFLEIGAHIGSATVVIAGAMKANGFGRLYCLEPQDHYFKLLREFVDRAGLADFATPLQMFSTAPELDQQIGGKVDMIYLDANHSYSAASADLAVCDRLLTDNGLVFLDDVGPDVSPKLDPEGRGGVRQALLDWSRGRPDLHVLFLEPPFWLNPCGMALVCKQVVR